MLRSFLDYLHYVPEEIPEVNLHKIKTNEIINKKLREINE